MVSLEAGGVTQGDHGLLVSRHRRSILCWLSSCSAGSLQAGVDARGTRGDFQRRCGTSIGTIDRQVAWPLTLDGEPGNEPQWRLSSLPSNACGRECLGASSSSKTL